MIDINNPAFHYYVAVSFESIEINRQGGLSDHLGLKVGPETGAFNFSLGQRVLRTAIYNTNWLVSLPGIDAAAETPLVGTIAAGILARKRQTLIYLREASDMMEESLEKDRMILRQQGTLKLPRTIELAVNDLTARSSVENQPGEVRIEIDPRFVEVWGQRWRPMIEDSRIPENPILTSG
jgi:hypothetical protein